jgi:hypothetical protein
LYQKKTIFNSRIFINDEKNTAEAITDIGINSINFPAKTPYIKKLKFILHTIKQKIPPIT